MQTDTLTNSCWMTSGSKLTCSLDGLVAAFGSEALLGFVVASVLFVTFYLAGDGDLAPPTVVLILVGGAVMGSFPPRYQSLGYAVVVVGVAAAAFGVAKRYVLSGAAQ